MADLVNDTAKRQLSTRNQEPTHLSGGNYDVLGGPGVASVPGGEDYKLDASKGIATDTTIPKSVGAEPSHLKTEDEKEGGDVDVDFGDDVTESDDLDKELDQFEDVEPASVDIDLENPDKEQHAQPANEEDESEKPGDEIKEEDENPFAKKDDAEDKDEVKEEDDAEKPGDEIKEEDEEDKDKEEVSESIKIRIKLPAANLFESAGLGAKTQKKVATIFESVIRDTTKQIANQVHAHYKKLHESKLAKRDAVMAKQMDRYLSYVVEEWVKQNRVEIRQSLRTQLAEEFLDGLQKLFKEHYIDVPESKVDVVKALTSQVNKLKTSLNEQVAQKLKLRKLAESTNKARIVAEMSRGLSEAQVAKLHKLAENTEYVNAKDFRGKVTMLKETYFPVDGEKKQQNLTEQHLPDATVVVTESAAAKGPAGTGDPDVKAIAETLSRQAQSSKW